MTEFRATITGGSATDQEFVSVAFTEAAKWYEPILYGGGTLDFAIKLGPLAGNTIAETGGMDGELTASGAYEPGTVTEIRTGIDPNGTDPDAFIDVDVQKLAATPNAIITMMHEIGHSLAFNGGGLGSEVETLFDAQTNGYFFIGEFAMQVYGGPIQLSADRHHILVPDMMYPTVDIADQHVIGALDIAIMADSGVPIVAAYLPAVA